MKASRAVSAMAMAAVMSAAGCDVPISPSRPVAEFIVSVAGEQFVLRTVDPETIRLAEENMRGLNGRFPAGPLRRGDGGFNAPWSWHLDPARTRFVEAAVGVCDGRPSYVEQHRSDFASYCPWGARVVERR